jgi:hypothetical protein
MKTISSFMLILFLSGVSIIAQNPYKYESKVVTINATKQVPDGKIGSFGLKTVSNLDVLQVEITKHNNQGYKLAQMTNVKGVDNQDVVVLVFEKSTSYREAELYKLINELTTKIDDTSRKHINAAKIDINTDVFNYLKSITDGILKEEYQEELRKKIVEDMENELKKLKEDIIKDIRNSSTGNN